MNSFYSVVAVFLFLNIVVGLWRAVRGPDAGDRLMAAQVFGTTTAAILLLLAQAQNDPSLRYVSLVFAALTVVAVVAFVVMNEKPIDETALNALSGDSSPRSTDAPPKGDLHG